jgi:hypothetical protein
MCVFIFTTDLAVRRALMIIDVLQGRDTSNLRDLLAVRSDYTWGKLDTEPVSLTESESRQRFPTHTTHAWICGGQVLRSVSTYSYII